MENWKKIQHFENYEVSDLGNVRNSRFRILNPGKSRGYLKVGLFKNGKGKNYFIHRLVAQAFIPNPENKPQVNHINGITSDNRLCNLEYNTPKENIKHAIDSGLINRNTFLIAENKRKKVIQINPNNQEVIQTFISAHEASKKTGFNRGNISTACRSKNVMVGGYYWAYIN